MAINPCLPCTEARMTYEIPNLFILLQFMLAFHLLKLEFIHSEKICTMITKIAKYCYEETSDYNSDLDSRNLECFQLLSQLKSVVC